MEKEIIKVPFGIKYISEWEDYSYPEGHCIVDKGVTGCGYTEYGLTNDKNVILCSPRKLLLENKAEKHKDDINILYLENNIKNFENSKDLEVSMADHIIKCRLNNLPIKFMITYDSAHYLIDYLVSKNLIDRFYIIADEFQSIFLDSYFKAEVENSFLTGLQVCPNIIYLSATPMLDKYLSRLSEFKDLKYYYIDWSDSGYVETIKIQRKQTGALSSEACIIVGNYLEGNFPMAINEKNEIVKSTEAVFYFNSVTEIIRVINKSGLTSEQVNILCSNTEDNRRKLKKIKHYIGKIPMENEPNKMFTFCTSTCYIGADFYSKCASTYIFADPNLKCLALDISLDLPQIAGRQRDRENPFKNNITIFYKTLRKGEELSEDSFEELQEKRKKSTFTLLSDYDNMSVDGKKDIIEIYRSDIEVNKYCNNFIGISSNGTLEYNKLIEIANERAWEVSQKDYQDSISLTKALKSLDNVEVIEYKDAKDKLVQEFLDNRFYATGIFTEKLKLYCEFLDKYKDDEYILGIIKYKIPDQRFSTYYKLFGTEGCRQSEYREGRLQDKVSLLEKDDQLKNFVFNQFIIGNKYSLKFIKTELKSLYDSLNIIGKTAKATDLGEWFELRQTYLIDPTTRRKDKAFEILKKKGE